jgi:hypothetical protein
VTDLGIQMERSMGKLAHKVAVYSPPKEPSVSADYSLSN